MAGSAHDSDHSWSGYRLHCVLFHKLAGVVLRWGVLVRDHHRWDNWDSNWGLRRYFTLGETARAACPGARMGTYLRLLR